jgi:hypothetical protein
MEARLQDVLRQHTDEIATEWALRAHGSSDRYAKMPLSEVEQGARRMVGALITAVSVEDFHDLYEVLQGVAEERAALGFVPSDVGRGLLIGCEVVLPVLQKSFADDAQQLVWSVARIERIMHRSITMLDQVFKDTEAAREMACLRAAAGRLNAVLGTLGYQCVAMDGDLVVLWQGPLEGACGDVVTGKPYPAEGRRMASRAALEQVARTGEAYLADEPLADGLLRATARRDEDGRLAEVVALYAIGQA